LDLLTVLADWAQIIGLPVAIIAIVISVWLFLRGRQKRAVTCTFDSIASPVEVKAGEALKGDIEIRYKGKVVENLFIIRAYVKNAGNLAIRKSDVVEPIKFTFAENSELIRKPLVLDRRPSELSFDWAFGVTGSPAMVNSASLILDLLNPGDELAVEFVCTGNSQFPTVSARIEGVSEIDVLDPEEARMREVSRFYTAGVGGPIAVSLAVLSISLMLLAIDEFRANNPASGVLNLVWGLCALWVVLSAASSMIKLLRLRKRKQKRD
jgi:hypothetical protein